MGGKVSAEIDYYEFDGLKSGDGNNNNYYYH